MATFNKFNSFSNNLAKGIFDFNSHTFKVLLTNTAPVATNALRGDLTELGAGAGYTSGGLASATTLSQSGATAKVTLADVTFTATASMGPFRYMVVYDDTATNDPLIGWADYGSSVTLASGQTFKSDFDDANGLLTIV